MCTISKLTLIVVSQARPFPFCSADHFQCAARRAISAVGQKGSGLWDYSHYKLRSSHFYMGHTSDHPLCVVTVKVHDKSIATFCRIVDAFQS